MACSEARNEVNNADIAETQENVEKAAPSVSLVSISSFFIQSISSHHLKLGWNSSQNDRIEGYPQCEFFSLMKNGY